MVICQKCNKKCEEVRIDYEYQGIILRDVKALRCPDCKEKLFTLEQHDAIHNRFQK